MTERYNRGVLTFLGLLLIVVGVIIVVAGLGLLPLQEPSDLFGLTSQQPELWGGIVLPIVALLILLLGLQMVLKQFARPSGPGLHRVTVQRGEHGRTTVESTAAAKAAQQDLARLPGVLESRARLASYGPRPELQARLDLAADADLGGVQRRAEQVYQRLAQTLGVDDVHAAVRLRPIVEPPQPSRVQ